MLEVLPEDEFKQRLQQAAEIIGIDLSQDQASALVNYVSLLNKWNRTYNLTAIRDPREMLERHIIDSLSMVPYIDEEEILDVGTGPGLPGIPLAIMFPTKKFSLLDSNIKKTRFLTQAVISLKLDNVEVMHQRIEDLAEKRCFPLIVSRAFTAADNFAELCGPCLSESGKLLAMKGSEAKNEATALDQSFGDKYKTVDIVKLTVPGCEAARHLIIIEKSK